MHLRVEHTTEFSYDGSIAEAYTELRLRPLEGGGQHCSSFRLSTEPFGLRVREYHDHFGNDVHHFDVLESHERLAVTAISSVMTPPAFAPRPEVLSPLEFHDYLSPTAYAPFAGVWDFAAEHAGDDADRAQRAHGVMEARRRALVYDPEATDVQTRADEVLALGRGVCQDFAHVLLAACRSRRHPGALRQRLPLRPQARRRQRRLARVGRRRGTRPAGWTSLDPTHDRAQTERYVRVAVGRDYADVPPTRGVYKGVAQETLSVRVGLHAL